MITIRVKLFWVPSQKSSRDRNIPEFIGALLAEEARFLEYLAEHRADVLNDFVLGITSKYKSETSDGYYPASTFDISNVKVDLKILEDIPGLLETCIDYYLTLLSIPKGYAWSPQEREIVLSDIDRAWVRPRYLRATLMSELIGREEAIDHLKKFHDSEKTVHTKKRRFEDITSLYEAYGGGNETSENDAVGLIYALINEGMVAFREEICRPHEALKEFDDHELIFLSSCYQDNSNTKLWNEYFVVTRGCSQTHHSTCDTCIHDTRVVSKIEHPPREFFEKLGQKIKEYSR